MRHFLFLTIQFQRDAVSSDAPALLLGMTVSLIFFVGGVMADSCVLAVYKKENKLKQNELHCKAEKKLRKIVNDVFGFRLTAEAVFNPYLVDFYIRNTDLAIEIDGGYHKDRMAYDNRRDMYLFEKYGLIVLRFTKDDIDNGLFKKAVWCACYGELIKKIRRINVETISRGAGAFIPTELKLL